jgi:F420 biosynthesis protein FbiB-like protein
MTNDILTAIQSRRSVRYYTSEAVPRPVIDRLLEAACWSPSAHNRQPWRFAIVTTATMKTTLAQAMGEQLRADRLADNDPLPVIEADVARSHRRISGGTVIIIICLSMNDMDKYPDARRQNAEHIMAVQGAAMAAQNLMLAAYAEGLGACWLCAPLFAPQAVKDILGLPRDWAPQGLLTLGYPESEPKPKARKPIENVVVWR